MFSFHKPKVYRSTQGCCICKAKSSSSRFTDSKKYENDFIQCFQLINPRKGEICNACVLLVKRFKRLPPGSNRHWGHVVDARVGPGLKSMTKFKKRKEEQIQQQLQLTLQNEANGIITPQPIVTAVVPTTTRSITSVPERFCKIFKKTKKKKAALETVKRELSPGFSDEISTPTSPLSNHSDDTEEMQKLKNSVSLNMFTPNLIKTEISRNFIETLLNAHAYEGRIQKKYRRKNKCPLKNIGKLTGTIIDIDNKLWLKIKTCCGYVYENKLIDAVIIDIDTYKLCDNHKKINTIKTTTIKTDIDPSNCNTNSSIKDIALIRRINNATNAILNQQTGLLVKDNNITNNMNNVGITGININNCIGKISDNVNVPTTAVKKHHLYSKRQNIIDHINRHEILLNNKEKNDKDLINIPVVFTINGTPTTSASAAIPLLPPPPTIINDINNEKKYQYNINKCPTTTNNYMHKIKSDSGKIIKNSLEKLVPNPSKIKGTDMVKNLVKMCTEKSTKAKIVGAEPNQQQQTGIEVLTDALGNKFSDNSSDSGYEETPLEQVNMLPKLKGINGNVVSANGGVVRSVVLANGIKVHVQPQNLVRAANWAGVPQTTMVTLQQQNDNNMHYNTTNGSSVQLHHTKLGQPTTSINNIHLLAGPEPLQQKTTQSALSSAASTNVTTTTTTAVTTNQNNIVLIKPKFLQQTAN